MTREEASFEEFQGGATEYDPHDPVGMEPLPEPAELVPASSETLAALAAFRAGYALGRWAKSDPVKEFASLFVCQQTACSALEFARSSGASESWVHRRIREAARIRKSAVTISRQPTQAHR